MNSNSKFSRDLYEILDCDRKASAKEIQKAYYAAARRWHPDRNQGDPSAEARFKEANAAYEVLKDPHKREVYDKLGIEGLDSMAAMENLDVEGMMQAMFGAGEFDAIFGDVCELPMIKSYLVHVKKGDSGSKEAADLSDEETEALRNAEEAYCTALGQKLSGILAERVTGTLSSEQFKVKMEGWATELCEAPGGLDLVKVTSRSWLLGAQKHRRRFFGLERVYSTVRGTLSTTSQFGSLIYGARTAQNNLQAMLKNQQGAKEEGKEGAKEGGAKKEEEDDSVNVELKQEEVMGLLRQGAELAWKFGLLLVQNRIRRAVDKMVETEGDREKRMGKSEEAIKAHKELLATALMEAAQSFDLVHLKQLKADPSAAGHPVEGLK